MRINKLKSLFPRKRTHEGAVAARPTAEQDLRRSVMACMLWEDQFYESGVSISDRIATLVPKVKPETVAQIAVEARTVGHLRHAPLLVVREMCRHPEHRKLVAGTMEQVIRRADELAEFVALYWKDGRQPLASQVKKGLARVFTKFDAYQLAKHDREGAVALRDVMFLVRPKPKDPEQAEVWRKLANKTLEPPDTWEVSLSAGKGKDKAASWTRLLDEGRLGAFALVRNLRNMVQAGVDQNLIQQALQQAKPSGILPFQFIAAAKAAPRFEGDLERMMLRNLAEMPKLPGTSILLIDVSGSMHGALSGKSEMTRIDAACGLAIMAREIGDVRVYSFSDQLVEVPPRHGFALRDAIAGSQGHGGTYLGRAVTSLRSERKDRLIVITDEQSHDSVPEPDCKGYMVNVAAYKNGVGYGAWNHIDGFSEASIRFVQSLEQVGAESQ